MKVVKISAARAEELAFFLYNFACIRTTKVSLDIDSNSKLGLRKKNPQAGYAVLSEIFTSMILATIMALEQAWPGETPAEGFNRERLAAALKKMHTEALEDDDSRNREEERRVCAAQYAAFAQYTPQMEKIAYPHMLQAGADQATLDAYTLRQPFNVAALVCIQRLDKARTKHEQAVLQYLSTLMWTMSEKMFDIVKAAHQPQPGRLQRLFEAVWKRVRYGRRWREQEAEEIISELFGSTGCAGGEEAQGKPNDR